MLAEQVGERLGIQVVAVVEGECVLGCRGLLGRQTALDEGRLGCDGVGEGRTGVARQPEGGRIVRGVVRRQAEGVDVLVVGPAAGPAVKTRALLEACVARAKHAVFGEPDALERHAHRWPRSLTDTDCRDVGRLDEDDLNAGRTIAAMFRSDGICGDPAGRTAADDHDLRGWPVHHRLVA